MNDSWGRWGVMSRNLGVYVARNVSSLKAGVRHCPAPPVELGARSFFWRRTLSDLYQKSRLLAPMDHGVPQPDRRELARMELPRSGNAQQVEVGWWEPRCCFTNGVVVSRSSRGLGILLSAAVEFGTHVYVKNCSQGPFRGLADIGKVVYCMKCTGDDPDRCFRIGISFPCSLDPKLLST